eukprot:2654743-Rhodomonas_salina.1
MASDKWSTPENIETHYCILCETLVETGVAVRNTDFDPDFAWDPDSPNDTHCQPCFIKPDK